MRLAVAAILAIMPLGGMALIQMQRAENAERHFAEAISLVQRQNVSLGQCSGALEKQTAALKRLMAATDGLLRTLPSR